MLYLALTLAAGLAVFAILAVRAFRDDYLMVLHFHGVGTFLFERDGERYERITPLTLPATALRYALRHRLPKLAAVQAEKPAVPAVPARRSRFAALVPRA